MMKVTLPVILSKVSSRKDRSYSLTFETRELSGESAVMLMDNLLSEGFLLYSPNDDITEKDIPETKADALLGKKSQAQRIRNTIFVMWADRGKQGSFDDYYNSITERILDQLKEKLEP